MIYGTKKGTSRRSFLRGVGACISLPWLEYFTPIAMADAARKRVVYCYMPNGAQWQPATTGSDFQLASPLQDLAAVKDYLTVISGLQLGPAKSTINGDHSRALTAFLSGHTPEFPGPSVTTSIDITLAQTLSLGSRVSNLCLAAEEHANAESGYTADYQSCLSWLGGASPNSRDVDPAVVFNRIFAAPITTAQDGKPAKQLDPGKSILDAVLSEANGLQKVLGTTDQQRLQEYLQSIRDLETRVAIAPVATCPTGDRPAANVSYDTRVKLFYDLLYHALACGVTNVATFLLASESTNQSYDFIGIPGSHHDISHDSSTEGYAKIAKIVAWHVGQFSTFCQKLQATPEGSGNMLDQSILLMGGGLGDGARHTHDNIPVFLVGKAGGLIRGGQHINLNGTPFCNLHVAMSTALGAPIAKFGDSNGTISLS
ncbi:MAG: DUF1552 domain-containing protein [Proteobacteria bacterium]|nr:DUF1552 domain-containing protein [Pseudomonadota bacterium]